MMSMSAVSVVMADDLCARGSSALRIGAKMRGTMARRPHRAKGKIAPDHTPRVRSNILRSDRYEFVAGPFWEAGRGKRGGGWGQRDRSRRACRLRESRLGQ